tara:strand:- start:402 stop:965 length:564 start_codon:yes stop_codon:yes gene_type:complete
MKINGFSLIEIITVVIIISIISSLAILFSQRESKSLSLYSIADQTGLALLTLINRAKGSQTTIRISCDEKNIKADFFRTTDSKSFRSNAINYSLDANKVTFGENPTFSESISNIPKNIFLGCPLSCGTIFITSDGLLLPSLDCSEIFFTFRSNKTENGLSKLLISKIGYPEIYIKNNANSDWREIFR